MKLCLPLESFRGSQAPCRAVCGTCGCFQKMHGGVSAPSFCVEFPRETGLILRCAGKVGTPCRQSRGIDPPVSIRRGEGAQMR